MTGFDLSQTKKELDGLESAGIYMNWWSMSLMWNLMWVPLFSLFRPTEIYAVIINIVKWIDLGHVLHRSTIIVTLLPNISFKYLSK